jgi:putative FmdB family regulatory protein
MGTSFTLPFEISHTLALDVGSGKGFSIQFAGPQQALSKLLQMPIYEYRCADCKRRSSLFYQTFSAASNATPKCEHCGSTNVSRLVSRVFQLRSEDAQLEDLADPSSFGDLDENDPKSVARWARKLGQQMGEDLGDDWGEMVDRLEAGEDLGDDDEGSADLGGGDDDAVGAGLTD